MIPRILGAQDYPSPYTHTHQLAACCLPELGSRCTVLGLPMAGLPTSKVPAPSLLQSDRTLWNTYLTPLPAQKSLLPLSLLLFLGILARAAFHPTPALLSPLESSVHSIHLQIGLGSP